MKRWFSLLYWVFAAIVVALLFISLSYNFYEALLLGVTFIPTSFVAKYMLQLIHFNDGVRRWIWPLICLCIMLIVLQYFIIFLVSIYFSQLTVAYPSLMNNPVFIILLLSLFIIPETLISPMFKKRDSTVNFICDRRKVKVEIDNIAYLESNDTEVNVHMIDGTDYRTRTTITSWTKILDDRFLRIHRSYLVNKIHISEFSQTAVTVADRTINISRKYRDEVHRILSK